MKWALDSSAIVAIALGEPEAELFGNLIGLHEALVGTPTLVEVHLVLSSKLDDVEAFMREFVLPPKIHPVAFNLDMYYAATAAFERYGKGRGHPAKLNFGDCMSYAVAKTHDVPLLYKGTDFSLTDLRTTP